MIPEVQESSGNVRRIRLVSEKELIVSSDSDTKVSNVRQPLTLFRDLYIAKHSHERS